MKIIKSLLIQNKPVIFTIKQVEIMTKPLKFALFSKNREFLNVNYVKKLLGIQQVGWRGYSF
jgi:hypothetical protein